MYEGMYTGALKQKAAGEAAKAKQLSDAEKEYQKALGAGSDKVIPSLVQRHEKAGLAFLAGSEEVLRNNPVNGINQVNRNFFQTKEQLNNLIQQSDEVRRRLAPGYYDRFIAPPKLLAALQSTKDIEEAYKDQASGLQEEAAKLGYELSFDPSGRVGIAFNDIPKVDVVKDYFNWQKSTVYNSDPELGDKFTLGRARRQEIERVVTPQASESVLSSLSGNRVFAANWDALGYDVTTPDGRTKIYQDFLAPKVDSFTSSPGGGGGSGAPQETMEVLTGDKSSKIDVNWGGNKTITAKKTLIMPKTTMNTNFRGAYVVGEDANYSELSASEAKKTGQFEVKDIRSMPTWTGKIISLPKGDYAGGVTLDSAVELKSGMPLPDNVKAALVDYVDNRLNESQLISVFGSKDKAAIKAKITDKDFMVGSGYDEDGKVKSETIFLDASSENLIQLEKSMKGRAYEKIKRHLRNAASNPNILYNVKEIGQSKGAEKPQSFDLLNFEQPTA